jgi:type IV pilus assembly protein PilM
MNLQKEIKLSDLVPKRKPSGSASPKPVKQSRQRKPKKQEIVGLKIGASQVAAAHVINNGSPKLIRVAREPLDPGLVIGGEVRDAVRLGEALDEFFSKHGLPRKGVRLGIGTNRVGVRVLDIEGIDDERQLGNAVMFQAHSAMAIPLDQAVLDYHVVSQRQDESGGVTRRVVLAAAYREPIDHFVEACRVANLELLGIDVEAFALLRAVAKDHPVAEGEEPTARVAVALGHDRSMLAISDGTVCDFTRVLDWGGAKLEAAIGRELGLTAEEAAATKLTVSLEEEATEQQQHQAQDAVKRELAHLGRELVASLQFYQSQPESLPIGEILVTGGTSRMPGLAEELGRLVRVPVRVADPLSAVEAPTTISDRDDLPSLSVAIGLGVDR